MNDADLESIQQKIGYYFKNCDLLQQAFTRRSYSHENGREDNEVLEFIGDKVLDLAVVKLLIEKYGYMTSDYDDFDPNSEWDEFGCEKSEAELTEIKKTLVQKKTLAQRIDTLQLAKHLIVGNGDSSNNHNSVKEDLFEAIVGAIAIDSNWNWNEIQNALDIMLEPNVILTHNTETNYVAYIQEWAIQHGNRTPLYYFEEGCYQSTWYYEFNGISQRCNYINNNPLFKARYHCIMNLSEDLPLFRGFGISKQEARRNVCELAYKELEKRGLLSSIRDEIENPNKDDAINQLEILARRNYFSIPTYDYKQSYDKNGNPIWLCICHIAEESTSYQAKASSKKNAKKSAAYEMLKHVLSSE